MMGESKEKEGNEFGFCDFSMRECVYIVKSLIVRIVFAVVVVAT